MTCPGQLLCVLAFCLWSSHIFSWGGRSAGDLCVVTQSIFQTYACCMDTFLYFHTRTWETFWLLGRWSEEHWVSLVSDPLCLGNDSLYIQYQPNMYSRGHFRSCIIFFRFVLSFKKTLQFNMWIREAHQWFLQNLLGNNSTSYRIFWVLHVYSQPFWTLWTWSITVVNQYNICLWCCVSNWTKFSVLMCKISSSVALQATNCAFFTWPSCGRVFSVTISSALASFEVQ